MRATLGHARHDAPFLAGNPPDRPDIATESDSWSSFAARRPQLLRHPARRSILPEIG
ncbi:hypothetical protein FRAAL6190 [Frankia alni ACN14a]|uniref:Uncharacterized protein n=1 Tax=Frankia alni (strain DSM 45986 / CECT 9034 / ACN14a) TaxID=326424 RepID=Q0RCL1_FRAAA|nr:hypothetical protein FRAAL6190 [Frankia alni ACN14a]